MGRDRGARGTPARRGGVWMAVAGGEGVLQSPASPSDQEESWLVVLRRLCRGFISV